MFQRNINEPSNRAALNHMEKEGETMSREVEELQKIIDTHERIVFFGGAGVSTESGIPDFRSQDGLYNLQYKYPPEQIISHSFFVHDTKEFYRFYKDKMLILDVEPNAAHRKLAELEANGKLLAVVTQNIDGLHQKAGSKKVYELHGSIHRNYCMRCGKFYGPEYVKKSLGVPPSDCGGIIKPDVVLYEEGLDNDVISGAVRAIARADCLIIGGTSWSFILQRDLLIILRATSSFWSISRQRPGIRWRIL